MMYSYSNAASIVDGDQVTIETVCGILAASDQSDAERQALDSAYEIFPTRLGYIAHVYSVLEITPDIAHSFGWHR